MTTQWEKKQLIVQDKVSSVLYEFQTLGNNKTVYFYVCEIYTNSMKRQNDLTLKINSPGQEVSNVLLGKSRGQLLSSRKNKTVGSKQEWCSVVAVSGSGSKVQCYKDQYCIVNWNVRSMSQFTLDVIKQEMARVNINILEVSELKWTGMGEFNENDDYIYYCGQELLRRNGVALIINKTVQNALLGYNLKNVRKISIHSEADHSASK